MKAFLDTSVLVAAFYGDHEHHAPSLDLVVRFQKDQACCSTHSLAEVYSTLTGMPGKWRVGGDGALLFLRDIRERLTLVSLSTREYFELLEEAATGHVAGGAIFDALLAKCALKAKAELLYTWNVQDFVWLSSASAARVTQPGQ
jgi:predicted nucleic acid-binding protein